jgi:CRISPR-associated protein Csb2
MKFTHSDETPMVSSESVRWTPTFGDAAVRLGVPRLNSLRDLKARHDLKVPVRTRKPSAITCLKLQSYEREDTCTVGTPAIVEIVQLVRSEGTATNDIASFDSLFATKYRAWLRGALVHAAREEIHWTDRSFALEMITGHLPDGEPSKRPHLALVPLPSLHQNGLADGQVRRFALVGYAPTGLEREACDVYRTLVRSVEGEVVFHDGKATGLSIRAAAKDGVWWQYASASNVWSTVLPIVLVSRFDVGKNLSHNEKHIRRQLEVSRLIRRALKAQGLPSSIAEQTNIAVSASPFIPQTDRVERYLVEGSGFRTHARIEFPCPVRGPLIIGDGRYGGMGLCFPS